MKKNSKFKVSEEELNAAIQKFLKSGGMISKLPEQKAYVQKHVGMKHSTMEIGGDTTI